MDNEELSELIRRLVLAVERISVDIEVLKDLAQASEECDIWTPEEYGPSGEHD